ncbi:MAG: amidinotransferase [Alphaproteobacteria bacterium]|nr:amidinotransferase [Alphaproteobacteria bacterium]MCB9691329.1 amidinotransferase [Alphaproteobacteria bacterium]
MSPRALDPVVIDRDLPFDPRTLPTRPPETGVLMADASGFDVAYVINPHMAGNIGTVDREKARAQWQALTDVYRRLGYEVHVIDAVEGLPDLVFTANQSFPGQLPDGRWVVLQSHMHAEVRRPEEDVVADWHRARGATVDKMSREQGFIPFEGMGDAHWFPGRRLIIGGHGFRTHRDIYPRIATVFQVPVVTLDLVDPRFYHLDTCLAPLDENTALFVPEAFRADAVHVLSALFERLIEVPLDEAVDLLACNGHCPDGKHFIVQQGAMKTAAKVSALGYEVVEVDTSEFLKSGGSVFCMKLMLP